MPRAPRLIVPNGLYHVTSNACVGRDLFETDVERAEFLRFAGKEFALRGWSCRAYCLLTSHYHLLVAVQEPDLSAGLQQLNGQYAQWANRRREQRGHLVRERFHAVRVETDGHALELHRYIALNPVRAGVAGRPEQWPWSSYIALVGMAPAPLCLDVAHALRDFDVDQDAARARLAAFVADLL